MTAEALEIVFRIRSVAIPLFRIESLASHVSSGGFLNTRIWRNVMRRNTAQELTKEEVSYDDCVGDIRNSIFR